MFILKNVHIEKNCVSDLIVSYIPAIGWRIATENPMENAPRPDPNAIFSNPYISTHWALNDPMYNAENKTN